MSSSNGPAPVRWSTEEQDEDDPGHGFAVSTDLGVVAMAMKTTVIVYDLPGQGDARNPKQWGTVARCELGTRVWPFEHRFEFAATCSGYMAFTPAIHGDTATVRLLVVDTCKGVVHVIDVVTQTHCGMMALPPPPTLSPDAATPHAIASILARTRSNRVLVTLSLGEYFPRTNVEEPYFRPHGIAVYEGDPVANVWSLLRWLPESADAGTPVGLWRQRIPERRIQMITDPESGRVMLYIDGRRLDPEESEAAASDADIPTIQGHAPDHWHFSWEEQRKWTVDVPDPDPRTGAVATVLHVLPRGWLCQAVAVPGLEVVFRRRHSTTLHIASTDF
jgi:hypothetical protein